MRKRIVLSVLLVATFGFYFYSTQVGLDKTGAETTGDAILISSVIDADNEAFLAEVPIGFIVAAARFTAGAAGRGVLAAGVTPALVGPGETEIAHQDNALYFEKLNIVDKEIYLMADL